MPAIYKPHWLEIAYGDLGLREAPGKANNPVILEMAQRLGGWIASYYREDSIPWCALWLNAKLQDSGIKGTNSLAARSFEKWGIPLSKPAYGCVMVFARQGGGHVGFYIGENATAYRILGANQSDAVTETWIAKDRLVNGGIRWPEGEPAPQTWRVILNSKGKLSANEALMSPIGGHPEEEMDSFAPDAEAPLPEENAPPPEKEPMSPLRVLLHGANAVIAFFASAIAALGAYLKMIPPEVWITLIVTAGVICAIYLIIPLFTPRPVILQKYPKKR